MKTSSLRLKLLVVFIVVLSTVKAQKKQDVLEFIEQLPTIEYGVLPYWHGDIDGKSCFEHGFGCNDTINSQYNFIVGSSLYDSCYNIRNNKKINCKEGDVFFIDKIGCKNSSYKSVNNESINELFCPSVFASAKSLVYDKYYVVYFWRALFTESILYYSLIFDFDGNLLSYLPFDYWHVGFPLFPFNSSDNKIRRVDYEKTLVTYLPNNLLLIKNTNTLEGGGAYQLVSLNEYGHYNVFKFWNETGEINYSLTKADKHINYIRIGEDGNKRLSLIVFVVKDNDGFSNIREEDNSSSRIIRTVQNGDVVFGTFLSNGWCKIEFTADKNGSIEEGGFIHVSRLQKLSNLMNEFVELPSRDEWKSQIKIK